MIMQINQAFELLIQSGELAPADAQRINTLIPELDSNGRISKDKFIALLFTESKNPDGAYRNFFSRVQAAIAQAIESAEEKHDDNLSAIFRSITVSKEKKTLRKNAAVRLSAKIPKKPPQIIARVNRNYLPENYQPSEGCTPQELYKIQKQRFNHDQHIKSKKQILDLCITKGGRKELYDTNVTYLVTQA